MPDIFLSYNREDQPRAKAFAEAFKAQGFDVWWDATLRSGEAYDQVTEKALREAKAVVVLWSKRSVESRWVRAEATLADRSKTLVPCMIEPCERPIMFELTQTADLAHWQGAPEDNVWLAFLADVNRFVRRDAPAPRVETASPQPQAAPPAAKGERGDAPSLAVLPFANRSGLPGDDALAYGMVEDIIAAISLSPDIHVLASSSTAAWAGKPTDLRVVGRDLGVRYVLEGNVRRAGPNLRVTVQLVEAETGKILWTQKFDRPLSELADLQEDLVTEVAAHLGVQVQKIEMERALKKPGDITAYEAVQRSLAIFGSLRMDTLAVGIAEARRAVAIAPDYGLAWSALAMSLAIHYFWTSKADESLKREALDSVRRALVLAPNDPVVLAHAGSTFSYLDQPREALRHAERALDLNPSSALAHAIMGIICLRLGRNDEAVAAPEAYERLAPGGPTLYAFVGLTARAHVQAGRLERAAEVLERSLRLNPNYSLTLVLQAGLCEMVGRPEDAADAVRRLRILEPATSADAYAKRYLATVDPVSSAPLIAAFRKVWDETPTE